ncbi:hypothetical protein Nepgr_013958 [Nepenthes gracilis]|uniref:Uncharacterized protein n=1 Tax=Nepenthes gracilis TaxID=150966 RepID=A0AAD3XP40_NEPGR|nr:hypothetical protein Nepgr_013958 [Nepenthes gracilis]
MSLQTILDEHNSNRSSPGFAITNSASCAHFGGADANDFIRPFRSVALDTLAPSRKRTKVTRRKPSSVEKLTIDFYNILPKQKSSYLSGSSENLVLENETPMESVEIEPSCVCIRHLSTLTQEVEYEIRTIANDYKVLTVNRMYLYSGLPFRDENSNNVNMFGLRIDKIKRNKCHPKRLQIIWNHNFSLCYLDIIDIFNFDVFRGYLVADEQQQVLKYPSSVGDNSPPVSRDKKRPPILVLVICLTREFAAEAVAEATILLTYYPSIGVQVVIVGTRHAVGQKRMPAYPCQILLATAGSLRNHLENTVGFATGLMGFRKDVSFLPQYLKRFDKSATLL